MAHTASKTIGAPARTSGWTLEHRFYFSLASAIAAAVFLGFARTFFLRHWFAGWAAVHAAREPLFAVHGLVNALWFALLVVQTALAGSRRMRLHRQLGWVGVGVAVAVVILGVWGSLVAAGRTTGFIDVPVPPTLFLAVPLSLIFLFIVFVTLAILMRRDPQSHKRLMILASVSLIEAAVGRWPFAFLRTGHLLPFLSPLDLAVDLFLLPLVWWDLYSRRRLHPVTLWGGSAIIVSHPLRLLLANTAFWQRFAAWSIHFAGR